MKTLDSHKPNPTMGQHPTQRALFALTLLLGLLMVTAILALTAGPYTIEIIDIVQVLAAPLRLLPVGEDLPRLFHTVIWNIRLPRIVLAACIGAALSLAGGSFQACFRNPLVEPYILGVSSGAAFGAALAIILPQFFLSMQLNAFVFGSIAVFASYGFARVRGQTPVVTLILSGVIVGSIFSALVSILKYVAADAALREIVFWLMGGFYYASWHDVATVAPVVLGAVILMVLMGWKLNVISMGDEEAKSLGVNPETYKVILILASTLMTAVSVAAVGIVAWVGLIIPHGARMLLGPDHRLMMPGAALMGATYVIICDTLARTLTHSEIPVGIMTSIIGAPFLIYLLRNKGKEVFGV